MYNTCNTGVLGRTAYNGGCYATNNVNGRNGYCQNGYGWFGNQRVCRDACGNLRVYTCECYCHQCGCGCNGVTGNDNTTGNGNTGTNGFGCITLCGLTNPTGTTTTATTANGDGYYARQYGLTNGRNGGCSCGYGWMI